MSLAGTARTVLASDAITAFASFLFRPKGKRITPSLRYIAALLAIIADLLIAAEHDPMWPCYRPLAVASFKGRDVGYRAFINVLDDLVAAGMVIIHRGDRAFRDKPGTVSRITPTAAFVEHMKAHGISPADRGIHFAYRRGMHPADAIRLKAGSTRGPTYNKLPGKRLAVDTNDPQVAALVEPILWINRYMADQAVGWVSETVPVPDTISYFRAFNCGDDPNHGWKKAGRLFCEGGGYQVMPKRERSSILINGLPTVEIDISACHTTIAYGLLGWALPTDQDVYWVADVPRDVVKAFANYHLGGGNTPTRWTADHGERFNDDDPKQLNREYPISKVGKAIMAGMPVLKAAMEQGITWADLQFVESQIIIATVLRLAKEYDIWALPVHDSIHVSDADSATAMKVLLKEFYRITGLIPKLKINLYRIL
jgi:hypothetical protein